MLEHLAGSEVPVTVIYGDRDSVVPTELSARVADEAPSLVERMVLHADHNEPVMFGSRVAASVERMARSLGDERSAQSNFTKARRDPSSKSRVSAKPSDS